MYYMASEQEQAEDLLTRWASDMKHMQTERDVIVTHALKAGVSKHRIYVLTGIARTTIDRIIAKGDQ